MYTFTTDEFEELKTLRWYKDTNGAWNESGINNPLNIGYAIEYIAECKPEKYEEWESYFYEKMANKEKILEFSKIFKETILKDKALMYRFDYASLEEKEFCKMVECRLIYETWLGYFAEKESCRLLLELLAKDGYKATVKHMTPQEDNKYAVDFLLCDGETPVCGLQIKPDTYRKSTLYAVQEAIKMNNKKNTMFIEKYRIPVEYVYYKKTEPYVYRLVNNGVLKNVESLLYNQAYPF